MSKYELFIVDDKRGARCIYEGNDKSELEKAVLKHNDEVLYNADKSFHLSIPFNNVDDFYSYRDFITYTIKEL